MPGEAASPAWSAVVSFLIAPAARLYAGAVAGLFLALGLSRWVWLEMRVDMGYLIPVCALGLLLFAGPARRIRFRMVLAAQLALAALFWAVGSFDPGSLAVLPAALVREGLGEPGLPLPLMNSWLAAAVVLGNLAWAAARPTPLSGRTGAGGKA